MSFNIPHGWEVKHSPRLYFKKFPHRVDLSLKRNLLRSSYACRRWANTQAGAMIATLLADPALVRRRVSNDRIVIYLATEELLHTFVKRCSSSIKRDGCWDVTVGTMGEQAANDAALDAKIEYRNKLYQGKFTYRLQSINVNSDALDALEAQLFTNAEIMNFYKEIDKANSNRHLFMPAATIDRHGRSITGDRARMQYGCNYANTIVYVLDEVDAITARMLISGDTKITKAVLAK
jgi:hypothetical protein